MQSETSSIYAVLNVKSKTMYNKKTNVASSEDNSFIIEDFKEIFILSTDYDHIEQEKIVLEIYNQNNDYLGEYEMSLYNLINNQNDLPANLSHSKFKGTIDFKVDVVIYSNSLFDFSIGNLKNLPKSEELIIT